MLIRTAGAADLAAIERLLASFQLPSAGVSDHLHQFLVAEDTGEIVASAGVEIYGSCALLRSVAVRHDYQKQGLGRQLVRRLLDRAHQNGVRHVYLLTTTASAYFQRLGFAPIPKDAVAIVVQASLEFQGACCESATAMRRSLNPKA